MKLVGVPMAQPLIKKFKGGPPGDSVVSQPTIEDLTFFKNPAGGNPYSKNEIAVLTIPKVFNL